MKIYLGGNSQYWNIWEFIGKLSQKVLQSYHYAISDTGARKRLVNLEGKIMSDRISLFLDSGAFSAFSQGIKLDINKYIMFIYKHKKYIDIYANLDVIGDPEATLKNQKIMEIAGLSPLPTFHYMEDVKYLKHYIENYDYIAIGGMVGVASRDLSIWLDSIFHSHICDKRGVPKVKTHGFGMTSVKTMLRYPWYSVDSTSWLMTSRYGSVSIPRFKNDKWIYDENPWKITFSTQNPSKTEEGKHFETLSPKIRKNVLDYIHHKGYKIGKSEFRMESPKYKLKDNERWGEKENKKTKQRAVEIILEAGISNFYPQRDELNVIYYIDLEKSMPKYPWAFNLKTKGFGL